MSRALALGPWPPTVSGILCSRHGPVQFVGLEATTDLTFRIIAAAFRALPGVWLEAVGNNDAKTVAVMHIAGPLCCTLGDATVEQLQRLVPAIWALRS